MSRIHAVFSSSPSAIQFTESFKWPGAHKTICFDGDSFEQWTNQALPICSSLPTVRFEDTQTCGIKIGKHILYKRKFPLERLGRPHIFAKHRLIKNTLPIYQRTTPAYCEFTKSVGIPILLDEHLDVWMSLTPNEVFTQRSYIKRTRGNVAVAGLGLGWFARKVLQRDKVKHLTIYEIDRNIIDVFGASLVNDFGDRVSIIKANAYDVDWSVFDVVIWDIWKEWGGASDDYRFWEIKRNLEARGKTCEGWGQAVHKDHY
jgi:hypothetical protein